MKPVFDNTFSWVSVCMCMCVCGGAGRGRDVISGGVVT